MTILNQEEPAHAAAAARLRTEPIIWLTTVARSGQPQSTPVWFLWEAGEFLIYGLANGPKTRNIGSNPYVSLHLEGNGRGGANVIFEGPTRPAVRRVLECEAGAAPGAGRGVPGLRPYPGSGVEPDHQAMLIPGKNCSALPGAPRRTSLPALIHPAWEPDTKMTC
jgi:PPOX class probable F420-dependent enzyme